MRKFAIGLAGAAALWAGPAHADTAILAGGCFWGMESVFEHVKGVTSVVSGYAGGSSRDASYDRVSSETTGHAEAVGERLADDLLAQGARALLDEGDGR